MSNQVGNETPKPDQKITELPSIQKMENQPPATARPSMVVSRLTHFMTIVYFGGFFIEFFSRGAIKPISQMSIIYTSLLTAYAGEKELRRWNGLIEQDAKGGKGEYIVCLWFLFYTFCWFFSTFKPAYKIPIELPTACISVLSILFGSKASKRFYQGRLRKSKNIPRFSELGLPTFLEGSRATEFPAVVDPSGEETELINDNSRIDTILEYLKKNGRITKEDAATTLGVSPTTAWRTLRTLSEQGKVKWVGKWKNDREGYYILQEGRSS